MPANSCYLQTWEVGLYSMKVCQGSYMSILATGDFFSCSSFWSFKYTVLAEGLPLHQQKGFVGRTLLSVFAMQVNIAMLTQLATRSHRFLLSIHSCQNRNLVTGFENTEWLNSASKNNLHFASILYSSPCKAFLHR